MSPAFDVVQADYTAKLAELAGSRPWETDKIKNLALAVRAVREVRGQIVALIHDGDVARHDNKRAAQIAEMPADKRRWALM